MKKTIAVIFICVFSTLFLTIGYALEIEKKDDNIKCGFNSSESNSIIVEGNNKCFKYERPLEEETNETRRLMIIAHPDDETIFGGAHLLEEKYTIVCITCGQVDYRVKEFEEVMKKTDDEFIMLGYVDRINLTGPISNWNNEYEKIKNDLAHIINSKNWDMIVTHNPDGEYGHIHHKKINQMVNNLVDKNKLYYFGRWYKENKDSSKIPEQLYQTKMNDLVSVYYNSQVVALNYNYNMLPYENWIKANEW